MRVAFTLGNKTSYDRDLAGDEESWKIGAHPDDDPSYEGGWVWRTAAEASAFAANTALSFKAAVYELHLPTGWDSDVSPEPHPEDGVHRLLNNARIMRRVD